MNDFCQDLAEKLKFAGLEFPKTVIFCRRYVNCALLYHTLKEKLEDYFTFPPKYPDFHEFRLIDMYIRVATVEMKEKILTSICDPEGRLCVIIAHVSIWDGH